MSSWITAPISRTCECLLPKEWTQRCGKPTSRAYKAIGMGWMAIWVGNRSLLSCALRWQRILGHICSSIQPRTSLSTRPQSTKTQIKNHHYEITQNHSRRAPWITKTTNELAKLDGFHNADDMFKWFRKNHKLPFTGILIKWK